MHTLYHNCRLIDGTGRPAIEQACLITEGGVIVYAGPAQGAPGDLPIGQRLDMQGRTLLPGLFNCHVHMALRFPFSAYLVDEYKTPAYRAMAVYRRAMEAMWCGVTTLRAVGEADDTDLAVRDAIARNMVMGSRIVSAGTILIAHGGHGAGGWGSRQCSGPAEFMKAARLELFKGVDLIKICITGGMVGEHEGAADMQMTEEEIAAVTQVAHNAGKLVAAHLGHDTAIQAAVRNGVDSVEHAYICSPDTAQLMARAGTWLVPTLAVTNACDYLEQHHNPAYHINKIRAIGQRHKESIAHCIRAGVKICVGTDLLASDPLDGTNATVREVELLTEAGMGNLEALAAATGNSAQLCGLAEVTGTLRPGLQADFIAVQGAPDQNIRHLRNLEFVAKGGSVVRCQIPGLALPGFRALPFGAPPEGASFIDW